MKTAARYGFGYSIVRAAWRLLVGFSCVAALLTIAVTFATLCQLDPVPSSLKPDARGMRKPRLLDRWGSPLTVTYRNPWNVHDFVPLHDIPDLLRQSFVESEDQRFYRHKGVDWMARTHAALQNVAALKAIRGASTITEQVVRMLHPRPRAIWSRWIEGIEAARLEAAFSKAEILELYLNQVPYASQRRGIVQAARMYFDRDPHTLSLRECLALAVLVRAPAGLDLRRKPGALDGRIKQLAGRMLAKKLITEEQYESAIEPGDWAFGRSELPVEAAHFAEYVYRHARELAAGSEDMSSPGRIDSVLTTTIDGTLQAKAQHILSARLADLKESRVSDGAVLIVDTQTAEIQAWVSHGPGAGFDSGSQASSSWIDAVTTPRQPGSTLKPFLYALALEKGMTAATLIDDSSLAHAVSSGLHTVRNYSRIHYGPLRLRDALGNSLNVPAVRTIRRVTVEAFLDRLHSLGFKSLARPASFYGEGLALGDGEVTLFELVQAYAALARGGEFLTLRFLLNGSSSDSASRAELQPRRVMSEEDASLIADILSDPQARRLEFGDGQILRFPIQTALKTGTSSDHRDAWAVGFTNRYTVGVWMGNLDGRSTDGVTGTTGPGLVLRAVFAELSRNIESEPLFLSARLRAAAVCRSSGLLAGPDCPAMQERFRSESVPRKACSMHSFKGELVGESTPQQGVKRNAGSSSTSSKEGADGGNAIGDSRVEAGKETIALLQPTPSLHLAMDPRIPDDKEFFSFLLPEHLSVEKVEWIIDGNLEAQTGPGGLRFLWKLSRGKHSAMARVWQHGETEPVETGMVEYEVW